MTRRIAARREPRSPTQRASHPTKSAEDGIRGLTQADTRSWTSNGIAYPRRPFDARHHPRSFDNQEGQDDLLKFIDSVDPNTLVDAIRNGRIDPNKARVGSSPLLVHFAWKLNVNMVSALLAEGANPWASSRDGQTAAGVVSRFVRILEDYPVESEEELGKARAILELLAAAMVAADSRSCGQNHP